MNLGIVAQGAKEISKFMSKNAPTILTGVGVGGVVTSIGMAIGATPKALRLIEEERKYREEEVKREGKGLMPEELTKWDIVRLTWKCYIPTTLMGLGTITCIVGSNTINLHRNAALAGLYGLAEASLKEYQDKVIDTLGQKKEERLRDEILEDKLNKNPPNENTVIITGKGETLCYDTLSGRYFKSDVESIRRAQNSFNQQMLMNDGCGSLNDFYDELGLERTDLGINLGWTFDYGLLAIKFSSKLAPNDVPCIVLEYSMGPRQLP